ncbi:hypothetical protein AB0H71_10535 [Nocardia sp. NPDC050697]|uniref:hypothetical protein n=1 Tax=Nocardia sp. NPDC050697 TaxID=3155158 RepID=UPI00340D4A51
MAHTYALYLSGNFLQESELDRLPGLIAPEVLSGERIFHDPDLTIYEEELRIDGSRSWYAVDGEFVLGRDIANPGAEWRISYLKLVTDGSRDDAEQLAERLTEELEFDHDDAPDGDLLPAGETVGTWEDDHGQWDLALVRL